MCCPTGTWWEPISSARSPYVVQAPNGRAASAACKRLQSRPPGASSAPGVGPGHSAIALLASSSALAHEVFDPVARLERGVELDERLGPEHALVEIGTHVLAQPLVADGD